MTDVSSMVVPEGLEVWPSWKLEKSEREARLSAFAAAIEADALGAALVPRPHEHRSAWPPAVRWPEWGMLEITVAPTDLVLAVRLARELATTHDVELRTHVHEASTGVGDPLASFRTRYREEGGYQVILWSAGPDPVRSLRAVHEVIGSTVAEAKEKLAAAPIELALAVSQDEAYTSLQILRGAGCEAEVVRPKGR